MSRLQHKIGRKSNYVKSLNNEYHKEVRRRVLLRDKFKCRFPGCESKIFLEMHHITYYINNMPILGRELESDNLKWCVILCDQHHSYVHSDLHHIWNPRNYNKQPVL